MSLFGPVTDAEQVSWQLRSIALLGELLQLALRRDLPPIRWTVHQHAALMAHCSTRRAWAHWVDALHLSDVAPEHVHNGFSRLRATGRVSTTTGQSVTVTVLADIDLEFEQLDVDGPLGAA